MKGDSTLKTIWLRDLVPSSPEQLRVLAYEATHGDMVGRDVGVHGRRNAQAPDMAGRTKEETFRAASEWIDPWFASEVQARKEIGRAHV